MCGTLATAGVHDLAHGNWPEFVAMAVKQPENPCDIGMNDWIMTDSEEENALLSAELDDEHVYPGIVPQCFPGADTSFHHSSQNQQNA